MTQQSTEYVSCNRLNCGAGLPASVILCVPSEIVEQSVPGVTLSTIEATLETEVCGSGSCGSCTYTYLISYDDSQLINGAILTGDAITGLICSNCFTTWVQEQIAVAIAQALSPPG